MPLHFDSDFFSWLHSLAGGSWKFDYVIYQISDNNLLKGALFLSVLWWWWFVDSAKQDQNRRRVISIVFACLLAVGINQLVQVLVPYRPRPYKVGLQGISFPYDLGLHHSNSFPSDHATLFFALGTGLFYLSWRAGLIGLLYAALVICLPRVYLGLHYPTDIIGGAVIGSLIAITLNTTGVGERVGGYLNEFARRSPAVFYPCAFLLTYQIATLFDDARALCSLFSILRG